MSDNSFDKNINNGEIKKKKKKIGKTLKCNLEGCNNKQSIIIGVCKWCNKCFCSNHRLPESHICINLKNCKEEAFNINENKLNNQKTICRKVIEI